MRPPRLCVAILFAGSVAAARRRAGERIRTRSSTGPSCDGSIPARLLAVLLALSPPGAWALESGAEPEGHLGAVYLSGIPETGGLLPPNVRTRFHLTPALPPRLPKPDPGKPWLSDTGEVFSIDLKNLLPPLSRHQGPLGACAAFAAVALYEAAQMRAGTCTRLSEADLFLQGTVLQWPCWEAGGCGAYLEGNNVWELSEHIRTKGVLSGDHYEEFTDRYLTARRMSGMSRQEDKVRRFLGSPFLYGLLFEIPKSEAQSFLESYRRESRAGQAASYRKKMAEKLSRYRPIYKHYPPSGKPWERGEKSCRSNGLEQEDFIDEELLAGRPVAVSMFMRGLKQWGTADPDPSVGADDGMNHAFLITGVSYDRRAGLKYYTTRNSWGGINPAVLADELCRVNAAASVLVPGETRTSRPGP